MFFVQPPLYGTNHGSPGIFPFFNPLAALAGFGLTDLYKQFRSNDPQQSMDPQSNPNSPENATLNALAMTIGMNPALASVLGIGSVVIGLFKKFSEKADKKAEKADPQAAEKFGLNAKNLDPEQLRQQLSVLEKEKEQLTTELRESQEDKIKAAELQRKIEELEENERKLREELERARKLAEDRRKKQEQQRKAGRELAKQLQKNAKKQPKPPAMLAAKAKDARDLFIQNFENWSSKTKTTIVDHTKKSMLDPAASSTKSFAASGKDTLNYGGPYSIQNETSNTVATKTTDAPAQAEQPNAAKNALAKALEDMDKMLKHPVKQSSKSMGMGIA